MPIRRSINAYRAATPFEQAGWTLAFTVAAIAVPALLRWLLGSLADEGRAQTGYPAAAARMAVHATNQLIQWIGLGILAATAVLCVMLAVSYARGTRERTGIPRWVIAETYAVGAVAALAGLLWLS
ncbi:hypothetical protein [Longimicrobium sp.]|uniref:hypothetical protein n=1 Tax=Longimicrobium sp. TaxID=2029185 RepID=UPI002E310BCA|nr:hypothetical protein [Longimicrobium sp.]HEX6042139.1 hypothetical protein [Longimicrobium sp.]